MKRDWNKAFLASQDTTQRSPSRFTARIIETDSISYRFTVTTSVHHTPQIHFPRSLTRGLAQMKASFIMVHHWIQRARMLLPLTGTLPRLQQILLRRQVSTDPASSLKLPEADWKIPGNMEPIFGACIMTFSNSCLAKWITALFIASRITSLHLKLQAWLRELCILRRKDPFHFRFNPRALIHWNLRTLVLRLPHYSQITPLAPIVLHGHSIWQTLLPCSKHWMDYQVYHPAVQIGTNLLTITLITSLPDNVMQRLCLAISQIRRAASPRTRQMKSID